VVMVAVVPASVALAIRLELTGTTPWSTVAFAVPNPDVPPALKVAVACALAFIDSGCAYGIVPSTAPLKVIGKPIISVRLAKPTAVP